MHNHSTIQLAVEHVLSNLEYHRFTNSTPLFVAIQGPQGSGKTYLTSQLRTILASPPHSLSVATLSIDDLVLPHTDLVALAERHHPQNVLLRGRGLPGTHDVQLGLALSHDLRRINSNTNPDSRVSLPVYDKSLHDGAGDRSDAVVSVCSPVDVVILEGWCVGFVPVPEEEIDRRWAACTTGAYRKDDILELNELLKPYVDLWNFFTVFIQIKTDFDPSYSIVYKWRLEQEHDMKARNGGRGLDDEQVRRFVDRFIPGYVFFGDGPMGNPSWRGRGLAVTIGENRQVLGVDHF